MSSIDVSVNKKAQSGGAAPSGRGMDFGGDSFRSNTREEYPVPNEPPYKARVSNLSWDVSEDDVNEWLDAEFGAENIVNVQAPKDITTGKLKGFAFVEFTTREALEQSLSLSGQQMNGRSTYFSVAAPDNRRRDDFDWGARRGPLPAMERGERGERPRRQEEDVDWSMRRGPLTGGSPDMGDRRMGPRKQREPREPRDEPEFDWGARRGPLPPAEGAESPRFERRSAGPRKPRTEEPDLDWGAKKGPLPAPERKPFVRKARKDEPDLDWGVKKGPISAEPKSEHKPHISKRSNSKRRSSQADDLDWSSVRSASNKPVKNAEEKPQKETTGGVQKSMYSVLADEQELSEKTAEMKL